jgi:hypothetical protein
MAVLMVQVRIVDMRVAHWLVPMPMRVRFGRRPLVIVLVMLIVHVAVLMLDRLVFALMNVPFREMKPQP